MNEEFKWENQKRWVKGWIIFFAVTILYMLFVGVGSIVDHYKNKEYRDGRTIASDWVQAGRPTEGAEFEAFQAHKKSKESKERLAQQNTITQSSHFDTLISYAEKYTDFSKRVEYSSNGIVNKDNDATKKRMYQNMINFVKNNKTIHNWNGIVTMINPDYVEIDVPHSKYNYRIQFQFRVKNSPYYDFFRKLSVGSRVVFSGTIIDIYTKQRHMNLEGGIDELIAIWKDTHHAKIASYQLQPTNMKRYMN
jgi:hypothetical protein